LRLQSDLLVSKICFFKCNLYRYTEGHILGFYGETFGVKSKERRECKNSGRFIHIPRQMLRSRILDQVRPGGDPVQGESSCSSIA
jgi:hypothetical protein